MFIRMSIGEELNVAISPAKTSTHVDAVIDFLGGCAGLLII